MAFVAVTVQYSSNIRGGQMRLMLMSLSVQRRQCITEKPDVSTRNEHA